MGDAALLALRAQMLFGLLWFALLCVWVGPAGAQPLRDAPFGPEQRASRDLEVHVDALPDVLDVDQIEVVVEVSDEYCKPKFTKLMGITLPVPATPHAPFFCKAIETYAETSPQGRSPLLSRQIWRERSVAAHVAQLDVPLGKRYVVLTRWRGLGGVTKSGRWVVEEALWDREQGRLLWLALRSVYTDDEFKKGSVWGMALNLKRYYEYLLPATLGQRGAVRDHAPVPGSRWVPVAEIPTWSSDQRAAIALANAYFTAGDRWPGRAWQFPIRAADQAAFVLKRFEWGQESWFQSALLPESAATPPTDVRTHALLEVPPGTYWVHTDGWLKYGMEIEVKAGQMIVVKMTRSLVGPDLPVIEDAAWWSKWLTQTGRHGFLEDRRPPTPNVFVETWFARP